MRAFSLSHVSDADLLHDLATLVVKEQIATTELLARIAEVDARKLYLPAGYPSMYAYCVEGLHLSEDAAYKRIQAARAARRFPVLFEALAEGRLHLTAVCLLAPHLTEENVGALIMAATRQPKLEIERFLANRFPRPDRLAVDQAIRPLPDPQLAPAQVGNDARTGAAALSPQLAPAQVGDPAPRPRMTPVAPARFALQVTIDQEIYDDIQYAQALLGHSMPSGDVVQVLGRALKVFIDQLEKRKFAATPRPRPSRRHRVTSKRHIPAEVRRAVWKRDGGQCTFIGNTGLRCSARTRLEFDHIDPVARGGQATVERMRLRCRAHNQYEAERTFGAGFMKQKREQARHAVAEARRAAAENQASLHSPTICTSPGGVGTGSVTAGFFTGTSLTKASS